MQAIVANRSGPPEVLTLRSITPPEPGPGEALVRLHAIGVNFADTERRRGLYDPPTFPWIPGNEGAGVVERVGPGARTAWVGQRVAFWGPGTSGTYAELVTVPTAALMALPATVSFETGAALPLQGYTAYGLAHFATALATGQTALVHAAAGGVGAVLVQLLRERGVLVFGTASTEEKRRRVEALGAVALPYGPGLPELVRKANAGRGVDAVFDSVGRATQDDSLASLDAYGQLVCFGEASGSPPPIHPDQLYAQNLRVSSFGLGADPPERWAAAREHLLRGVEHGTLTLLIGRTWPLAQAAEAHAHLETRQTLGKVLLLPA